MSKTVCVRFMGSVDQQTSLRFMDLVDEKLKAGVERIVLAVSSPGGSVFHGLSIYNYLKGIPPEIVTHNFGSVDSIGAVIFCAGAKRLSVPHARFQLHGVSANFPQGASLEEKKLEERLKSLRIDEENIAGVIAACTGRDEKQVVEDIAARTTLNPEQAVEYGLVHEVEEELIEASWELHSIQ